MFGLCQHGGKVMRTFNLLLPYNEPPGPNQIQPQTPGRQSRFPVRTQKKAYDQRRFGNTSFTGDHTHKLPGQDRNRKSAGLNSFS